MLRWFQRRKSPPPAETNRAAAERIREKYLNFREVLNRNTECLELIAGLQEDLQYIPYPDDVVQKRVAAIFDGAGHIINAVQAMTGESYGQLSSVLEDRQLAVSRYIATSRERATPRLAVSLSEVGLDDGAEVGGKAAYLGEIKNKIGLPVPDGFILTTEAYRQFCGIPNWQRIRDAIQAVDLDDPQTVQSVSGQLQELVLSSPLPRAVEVAVEDRARSLGHNQRGLAVRSSAMGEGGAQTYAGQFLSLINVPAPEAVDAYRKVIAARFSERALAYRLSTGLLEVDSPMAVLVVPVIRAAASGVMYSRDPANPKSKSLWITATHGLGLDIASGQTPADLFVVERNRPHRIIDTHLADKTERLVARSGGGLEYVQQGTAASTASLADVQLAKLADYAVEIERHFGSPQDIEWVVDEDGTMWVVQSRPLALVGSQRERGRGRPKGDSIVSGGHTIFPGRVSGRAYLVRNPEQLRQTPDGAIIVLRSVTPAIVPFFPRISGVAAEWGNVAGHSAALLREFKIPSVFLMEGLLDRVQDGQEISLDAAQRRLYPGLLWEGRQIEARNGDADHGPASDPISQNILNLQLVDPASHQFRPGACKSVHDLLRFCHETSVDAMFAVNDTEMQEIGHGAREIKTKVPLNLYVLDLGGGLDPDAGETKQIDPERIQSKPFRSLWRGATHPGVSWRRELPAQIGDVASLLASSFTPKGAVRREVGQKSYLLVADEYMNFNSRLAFHFNLVDACLCDDPVKNYVSFRFAGGGATRYRRNLRAIFVEDCLKHYGFIVHRRGDLLNAWLRKGPYEIIDHALDILGRLLACTSQLDMYMSNRETMRWFVEQFLTGNYEFKEPSGEDAPRTNA